ncbi:MAG: hypothetical protein PHW74_11990 [Desulfobacca sp.]|nr:hypothetical protein [Desulfobacca sp.]
MGLFGKGLRLTWPGVLIGVGIALAAPVVLAAAAALIRPAAKAAIKGGLVIADKVKEYTTQASAEVRGLVSEAQAEPAAATPVPISLVSETEREPSY